MNSNSDASANVVPNNQPVVVVKPVAEQERKRSHWIFWLLVIAVVVLLIWALSSGKGLGVQCYRIKDLEARCAGLVTTQTASSMNMTMPSRA
jgi:hypothetical protein